MRKPPTALELDLSVMVRRLIRAGESGGACPMLLAQARSLLRHHGLTAMHLRTLKSNS